MIGGKDSSMRYLGKLLRSFTYRERYELPFGTPFEPSFIGGLVDRHIFESKDREVVAHRKLFA